MRAATVAILCIGLLISAGCLVRSAPPQHATVAQTDTNSAVVDLPAMEWQTIPLTPHRASVIGVVEVNRQTAWWKEYLDGRPQLSSIADEKGLPNWVFPDVDWYEASLNEACEVVRSTRPADVWVYDLQTHRAKAVADPTTGVILLETELSSPEAYRLRITEDGVPVLLSTNSDMVERRVQDELMRERLKCLQGAVSEAKEGQTPQGGTGTAGGRKDGDDIYRLIYEEQRELAEARAHVEAERNALEEERRAFADQQQKLIDLWGRYAVGEEWVVRASSLNVRATPRLYGKLLFVLPEGSSVRVLRREGPWARIAFLPNGSPEDGLSEGWVVSKFLSRPDAVAEAAHRGSADEGGSELLPPDGEKVAAAEGRVPGEMEIRIEPTKVPEPPSPAEPDGVEQQGAAEVVAREHGEEEEEGIGFEPGEESGLEGTPSYTVTDGAVLTAGESYPFVVHVGTFASAEDAEEAAKKWRTEGHLTYPVLFRTSDEQSWYRVYLGRFATREEAEIASVKLRHEKKIPYSLPLRVPYALLTGSFERQEDAEEKEILLQVKGLLPYVLPFATEDGVEHRVYIGAYPSVEQAEEEGRVLKENHTAYTVAGF